MPKTLTNRVISTALKITEPKEKAQWDLSQTNTIKWDHVDSDPETFQLVLVDHQTGGEQQLTIEDKVKTSDGEYKLTNFVATPGSTYSIKAYGTEKTNNGQLSESQTFTVSKSGGKNMSSFPFLAVSVTNNPAPLVASTSSASGTATAKPTSSGTPSSTESATPSETSNAASALGVTFGVAGPLAAVFALLY